MQKKIRDSVNLFSKLTPQRFFNAIQVLSSYYYSKYTKKPTQWGLPISISVEPTTSCNLRCPECPSGLRQFTRPTGMLNESFFRKTIDELHKKLLYLTFYFQGEPYLNPGFLDMVNYASSKGIYTSTSTNAHYLNKENARKTVLSGLSRLIISIDGTTQETYSAYRRGGSLQKVIEGTKNVIESRRELGSETPYIIFQFLVVKPNEHQIEEVKEFGRKLGVDEVKFKTAQVYDFESGHPLIPENQKYTRYKKQKDGKYAIKNELNNHCWKLWHSCVITWDGLVVPCCFDKDARHQLGSLKKNTFVEIWKDQAYQKFRASLLRSRKETDICTNCSEGTRVWA